MFLPILSWSFLQQRLSEISSLFKMIYSSLQFLDLFNIENIIKSNNVLDSFALMMEEKIKLKDWERDLVFMQNEFKLLTKNGKIVNKKYDFKIAKESVWVVSVPPTPSSHEAAFFHGHGNGGRPDSLPHCGEHLRLDLAAVAVPSAEVGGVTKVRTKRSIV